MDNADFIREVFARPPIALEYSVSQDLAALFPDKALIEGEMGYFDVESFAAAGLCRAARAAAPRPQVTTFWVPPEPELAPLPYPGLVQPGEHGQGRAVRTAPRRATRAIA